MLDRNLHARHTGDVVFMLSSILRKWLGEPGWDVQRALRVGLTSRAPVEWMEADGVFTRRTDPTPAKVARRQIRLTTISFRQPAPPSPQGEIPVSVLPACNLEPNSKFRAQRPQRRSASGHISGWAINPQLEARDTRII